MWFRMKHKLLKMKRYSFLAYPLAFVKGLFIGQLVGKKLTRD